MVRFAVIGTNKITDGFLNAAMLCEDFKLAAVYSRSKEKALEFGSKYGVTLVYDDLDELAASNEIDAVYVASPNSLHASQSIKMLMVKNMFYVKKP